MPMGNSDMGGYSGGDLIWFKRMLVAVRSTSPRNWQRRPGGHRYVSPANTSPNTAQLANFCLTMTENPYEAPQAGTELETKVGLPPAEFKDRSWMMMLFGIFVVLGGMLFVGLGVFYAFFFGSMMASVTPAGATMDFGSTMEMTGGLCIISGIFALWLGMGSIMRKRWARANLQALGWLWTGGFVVGIIANIGAFPIIIDSMSQPQEADLPEGFFAGMVIGMLFFYLMPGVLLMWIYSLRNVRLTAEFHDNHARWTDPIPNSVLIYWQLLAAGSITFLAMSPFYHEVLAMVEVEANPILTVAGCLIVSAVLGLTAFGFAKLKPWAWWVAAGLSVLGVVGTYFLSQNMDPMAAYEDLELSEEELEMYEQMTSGVMYTTFPAAFTWVVLFGFLIWIKRHFRPQLVESKTA